MLDNYTLNNNGPRVSAFILQGCHTNSYALTNNGAYTTWYRLRSCIREGLDPWETIREHNADALRFKDT